MSTFKNVIAKNFEKIELFLNFFQFFIFFHISSPISESFIAQLLLHRALDQKDAFFPHFWENPYTNFCQCSRINFQSNEFLVSEIAVKKFSAPLGNHKNISQTTEWYKHLKRFGKLYLVRAKREPTSPVAPHGRLPWYDFFTFVFLLD